MIIEKIKEKIRKGSSTCKCINSITLVSCFGGTNGNAKAIADATGIPVIAVCGDGFIYPYQHEKDGPIGFFEDSASLGLEVQGMDEKQREVYNRSFEANPSYRAIEKRYGWGVVHPTKKNNGKK